MHKIGLAICSLLVGSDGAVQLFPAGKFDAPRGALAGKGPWLLDDASAAALIQRVQSRKNDIVFDYEHQTLLSAKNGQPAPAAGWGKPAALSWVPSKGLMLSSPEWTPKATDYLNNKEYKYISPVFTYNPQTGHVLDLLHVALTNNPAIDGMDDVLAAASLSLLPQPQQEEAQMNEEQRKALAKQLGLSDDASVEEVLAAASAMSTKVTDLEQRLATKDEEVAAASAATPESALAVINDLNGQVAALTARIDGNDKESLIAAAKADGKLTPAMETWARGQDVSVLKSFLESAAPIAALTAKQTDKQQFDQDGKAVLSEGQLAVCSLMNIDPADFAKELEEAN